MKDIIELAREAGGANPASLYGRTDYWVLTEYELERFAALVRAAALEEAALMANFVAREIDDTNGTATYIAAAIRALTKEKNT